MDAELERAIDDAGRHEVFARARRYGWARDAPKHVWWGIVAEIKGGKPCAAPPQGLAEAITGMKLFG